MTEAKPLTEDEEQALRKAWASIDDWEQHQATDPGAEEECPLCCGEGYLGGVVLDAVGPVAATVVGYGIGEGLDAARLVAESTGRLLATLDAERAKVAELTTAMQTIAAGKIAADDDHPLGVGLGMAGRFVWAARTALKMTWP